MATWLCRLTTFLTSHSLMSLMNESRSNAEKCKMNRMWLVVRVAQIALSHGSI